jgi:hypothetical protein
METPFNDNVNPNPPMQEGINNPQPQMAQNSPNPQPQMNGGGQPNSQYPQPQMQEGGQVHHEDTPMEEGGEIGYLEPIDDGRLTLNWGLVLTFFK